MSDFHYVAEVPTRQVLDEIRSGNAGKKRQEYCRYRSTFYTLGYRALLAGAEEDMARAALLAAQTFGGRVVKVSISPICCQLEYICPASIAPEEANVRLRRAMSNAYKAKHRGIGPEDSRGYLWRANTITETVPVLLGQPLRYETI